MWQAIGGLLVVGALIFFHQGYPDRALLLLSPFLLFGALVAVLTVHVSLKEKARKRELRAAEAEQDARHAAWRAEEAHKIRPLRDLVLADAAHVKAAVREQRELTQTALARALETGAPPAKIEALEACIRDIDVVFRIDGGDTPWQLPEFKIAERFFARPERSVGEDWTESVVYDVWKDSDYGHDWPGRKIDDAGGLIALALGHHADTVRRRWPQLVAELSLDRFGAAATGG